MIKKVIIFLFVVFFASNQYLNAAEVPVPQKNPIGSGYSEFINSLNLPSSADQRLLQVQNSATRKAIFDASQGKCPSSFKVKGTDAKVEHAKQCGGTDREKKEKNGRKCYPSGVTGGSVEAMCINGCCVGLGVKYNTMQHGNYGNSGTNSSYLDQTQGGTSNNPANQSLFGKMFGDLFSKFMQGGGGGSDSSYNPYNYNYEYLQNNNTDQETVLNINDTDDTDTWYDTNSPEQGDSIMENVDIPDSRLDVKLPEDSIVTTISKNGNKIEVKLDDSKDQRYAFVSRNKSTTSLINRYQDKKSDKDISEEIILNETHAAKGFINNTDNNYINGDPASTGFKGEKVGAVKQESLLTKIVLWLGSLLGF